MPNWCNNNMELIHDDPEMIKRAFRAIKEDKLFSEFQPCPNELKDTTSGFGGEGYAKELNDFKVELNKKYFGASDWYDWCVTKWGTKWDICEGFCESHEDKYLTASFDTAWSPPTAFYEKMKELGFVVRAFYYEPGMAFCGSWTDGDEEFYEIKGDSNWVEENIPDHIDYEFGISEGMKAWEDGSDYTNQEQA